MLTSITGLVTLSLRGILSPTSLPINYLVSHLSLMPLLEYLYLEFASKPFGAQSSSPGNVDNNPAALQMQMVQLSKLDGMVFRGHCHYLEGLVSCIHAPLLTSFMLLFFSQPSTPLPCLSEFLTAAEELRYSMCSFTFSGLTENLMNPSVSIVIAGLKEFVHHFLEEALFHICFPCRSLDAQVACAAQISTALAPVLSSVERLHLRYYAMDWHMGLLPEIPREAWFELLQPFSNVKKLRLDSGMMQKLSDALCPGDRQPAEGVLPKLSKILRPHHADFGGILDLFIAACQAMGQPISKHRYPPTHSDSESEDEL